jgi:hypothetical protein
MTGLSNTTFKNKKGGLHMVVHACNPSYSEGRDRRIADSPGKKHKVLSEKQTENTMTGACLKP